MAKIIDKTEGLLSNPKRAMAWAIVVTVVVVLFFVFKSKIVEAFSTLRKDMDDKKAIEEEIKNTGQSPSYSDSEYRIMSGTLYTAMKGWGTDEEAIYGVFRKMRNSVDVLKLIDAFGVKDGQTLGQWLKGDLSSWNFNKINEILQGNGINFDVRTIG